MPDMQNTPIHRIKRTSLRQNWLLFGIFPIVFALACALLLGGQRIIDRERDRLLLDFTTLIGYIKEQEIFLRQLRAQSQDLEAIPYARVAGFREVDVPSDWKVRLFLGQESVVDMPFSLACALPAKCSTVPGTLFSLGSYLSDFYSTFWASSYFPAAPVFFVNPGDSTSISVPAINTYAGFEPLSLEMFRTTIAAIQENLKAQPNSALQTPSIGKRVPWSGPSDVHWVNTSALPDKMIGWVSAGFPSGLWDTSGPSRSIYAATLFSRERINVLERNTDSGPPYKFWLQYQGATLMGDSVAPDIKKLGLSYTRAGLVWKALDKSGAWSGTYLISYPSFFQDHIALLVGAAIFLALSMLAGLSYTHWYKRRVMAPAMEAQRKIDERDAFNLKLIQTAPVALCVISKKTGRVVFSNSLAQDWLGNASNRVAVNNSNAPQFLQSLRSADTAGGMDNLHIDNERTLSVAYTPVRYMDEDAVLCVFTDISTRVEIERTLERARQAADEASDAKSTFLSTMSHEIRTPLYGVLGTLELLTATRLDDQQRQYVDRIEGSSQILLQLISDILDVSKIEAGQLKLERLAFSARELVQECTSSYAALAQQKGLLLFSTIDTCVPDSVFGDPVRVRQILSNLISNAIKFTEAGNVIVRCWVVSQPPEPVTLQIEVADSGVGIDREDQMRLFTPFYIVEGSRHVLRGAGLGLSICARLAELMGSAMCVKSEKDVGSVFSIALTLDVDHQSNTDFPNLSDAHIAVRTPHPELTENICAWLTRWRAQARAFATPAADSTPADLFLDVLSTGAAPPPDGHGHYANIAPFRQPATHPDIDGYDLLSIGRGIERILHNRKPEVPPAPVIPRFSIRILVAEDNPINQTTILDQLERLGCNVTLAEDGEDALALWDVEPHDFVLTDVNMPLMNGYDLARTLRSEGVTCPIIGITANAMLDEQRRCISAGMNAWMVKPIRLNTLIQLLREYAPYAEVTSHAPGSPEVNEIVPAYVPEGPPHVSEKYRDLFLRTMHEDMLKLEAAQLEQRLDIIVRTLHRISGALVDVSHFHFAQRMQKLEKHLQYDGLNRDTIAALNSMIEELKIFLAGV
ncbi:response regulator [Achromobacter aegrifaciens]|uniref:hybrid sensor histidine kinase/response regulator n=1 Tax=Achromobacter aegrifaciens TaxID=1287736 RepID=UPI0027BA447E|nr:hybrid sensor histidine kinase/response regulator [Achromobacter aegrifaciens]WLW63583.1 response regulator [Achromobacter aegrifaciens]